MHLEDMVSHDKLSTYMEQNIVEIVPLAYMRGRTLSSAFVISRRGPERYQAANENVL